jgi:hypothetical protein
MRNKRLVFAVILAVTLLFAGVARADDFWIRPFKVYSQDSDKVLIFNDQPLSAGVYFADTLVQIYSLSDALASFHWVVYEDRLFFSTDFRHLAFLPIVSQTVALAFYDNGVVMRQYMIEELVKDTDAITFTASTAKWLRWPDPSQFDAAANILTLATVEGLEYSFDITTGDVVRGEIIARADIAGIAAIDGIIEIVPIDDIIEAAEIDNIVVTDDIADNIAESPNSPFILILAIALIALGIIPLIRLRRKNPFA